MRKAIYAGLCVVLSGCTVLGGASKFVAPKAAPATIEVSHFDFDSVTILAPVNVENTSRKQVEFGSAGYTLSIAQRKVGEGTLDISGLDAEQSETIPLEITLNYEDLMQQLGGFADRETLPLMFLTELESREGNKIAEAYFSTSTSRSVEIPALSKPQIIVDALELKSFNLAIAELELRVRIMNPNAVPLDLSGLQFSLSVDGKTWHTQEIRQNISVPVRSDVVLDAPFSMRPREHGTEVYRMLNMSQEFEFTVSGNGDAYVDIDGFVAPYIWDFERKGSQKFERLN
jgi:LEA14-like dessication related protein